MSPGAGGSGGSLLLFLTASALVIGLTYGASRLLGQWQVKQGRGRRMRVLEGIPAGRDRSLLLVRVGKEVLVVGSSPSGFATLHQVTDPEDLKEMLAVQEEPTLALPQGAAFTAVEASVRTSLGRIQNLLSRGGGGADA
jgi:flagellar biogenesis protein FliO